MLVPVSPAPAPRPAGQSPAAAVRSRAVVAHAVSSALARSRELGLFRQVYRAGEPGAYLVPSTSRAGLSHVVQVRPRCYPGEPVHLCYACSCEARRRIACVHRAAVYQALYRQRFGTLPVGLPAAAIPPGAQRVA